ncbi:hypothetical protein [Sporosarcina sp. NCCP-2222]|uniref:hypothetical protein n=1 Tax=Sporosarcina sp. NCCP-2222 TaxID=2935073 RepID=UPI0020BE2226|nr:hypothetical protein [Sporosarcina sp. NCCP-2222]
MIRAVTKFYEWFETRFERLIKYTRGSKGNTSGSKPDTYDYRFSLLTGLDTSGLPDMSG